MLQNIFDDKSTLVQVMAWCHQATSHYLSHIEPDQCHHITSLGVNGLISCFWVFQLQSHFLTVAKAVKSKVADDEANPRLIRPLTWVFFGWLAEGLLMQICQRMIDLVKIIRRMAVWSTLPCVHFTFIIHGAIQFMDAIFSVKKLPL